jgi:hypothetical protein
MQSQKFEDLHSRALRHVLPAPATTAHALRLLSVAQQATAALAKHASDPHLNFAGQKAKTRTDLTKVATRLALAEQGIERERAAAKSGRDALEQKAFEKYRGDVAAPEIRAALSKEPHGEKIKLAAADPRILAALLNVPAIVHGVAPDALAHLVQGHLETNHAPALKKLDAKAEALTTADACLRVARETLFEVGGFAHAKDFDDWRAAHGTPGKLDLDAEAAGRTAHGHAAWSMSESFELTNSDAPTGLPK